MVRHGAARPTAGRGDGRAVAARSPLFSFFFHFVLFLVSSRCRAQIDAAHGGALRTRPSWWPVRGQNGAACLLGVLPFSFMFLIHFFSLSSLTGAAMAAGVSLLAGARRGCKCRDYRLHFQCCYQCMAARKEMALGDAVSVTGAAW